MGTVRGGRVQWQAEGGGERQLAGGANLGQSTAMSAADRKYGDVPVSHLARGESAVLNGAAAAIGGPCLTAMGPMAT